jgi:hypothetical protein
MSATTHTFYQWKNNNLIFFKYPYVLKQDAQQITRGPNVARQSFVHAPENTKCCSFAIIWNAVVQPGTILRYFVGPVNNAVFCNLDFLFRNVISLTIGLLQNSVIISRYICLHWAKNPTALQDDFWKIFINLWTFGIALLSQIAYVLLPGKKPMNYYICIGEYPIEFEGIPIKANYPHFFTDIFNIFTYIFAKIAERKGDKVNAKNSHTLFTFSTYGLAVLLLLVFVYVPIKINSLGGKELEFFSNYVLVYILHHFIPSGLNFTNILKTALLDTISKSSYSF